MAGVTDDDWGDRTAAALGRAFDGWLGQAGRGTGWEGDICWLAGPEGLPMFSGLLLTGRELDVEALRRAEERVSALQPLHRIDLRADADPAFAPWAAEHGYVVASREPALVLSGDDLARCVAGVGVRSRRAGRSDVARHHEVSMSVFGLPVEETRVLAPDSIVDDARFALRIAEVDGVVVGTAQSWIEDDSVGVFNVTVVPEHRGRGLGAELTAAAVADGVASGASWAYLQSSDAGLPVYRRMGFRVVDQWLTYLPTELAVDG